MKQRQSINRRKVEKDGLRKMAWWLTGGLGHTSYPSSKARPALQGQVIELESRDHLARCADLGQRQEVQISDQKNKLVESEDSKGPGSLSLSAVGQSEMM